jgi:hypothetical protein
VRYAVTTPPAGALRRAFWALVLAVCAACGVAWAADQPTDQAQPAQEVPPIRPARALQSQTVSTPEGGKAASTEKGAQAEKPKDEAGPPVSEPK